jgi:hypothetical protein
VMRIKSLHPIIKEKETALNSKNEFMWNLLQHIHLRINSLLKIKIKSRRVEKLHVENNMLFNERTSFIIDV